MNILISITGFIIFIFLIKKLLTLVQELDTIMSIRKGLRSAELLYRQKYEFRLRDAKFIKVKNDNVVDFSQFRGRL